MYTADAAEPGRAFVARTKLPASLEIVRARAFMELASIAASSSSDAKLARQELFSGVDQWGGMRFMRLASTCTSVIDALSLALEAYVEMRAEKPTTLPEASKILLGPRPAEARNMTDAEIASVTWTAMRRAREAKSKPWVGPEWWRSIIRGPFEPIDPVAEQRHDESAASSSGKTPWTPLSVARRPVQRQAQALLADAAAVAHAARAMASMIQASAKGEDTHRVAADAIPAILQSLLRLHIALDTVDAKLTSKIWAVPYPSLKHTRGKAPKRGRKLKRIALPPSGLSLLDSVDKAIVQVCNCVVTDADGIDVIKFSDPALDDCYASFQAAREVGAQEVSYSFFFCHFNALGVEEARALISMCNQRTQVDEPSRTRFPVRSRRSAYALILQHYAELFERCAPSYLRRAPYRKSLTFSLLLFRSRS